MEKPTWLVALFKSIDTKDTPAFAKLLTGDVIFRFGNSPEIKGRVAVSKAVQGFFQSIKSLRHEISQSWAQGDTLICHGTVSYTRTDNSVLTVPFANIFTVAGGRVSRYLIFVDNSALYGHAG